VAGLLDPARLDYDPRQCPIMLAMLTLQTTVVVAGPLVPLDGRTLAVAVDELAERDADLAAIVERHGRPPLWDRAPGFATLLHIILEQQVSLASALAAFDRLRAAAPPLSPGTFLALSDAELLAIGFSRQKARYGRALATAIDDGTLDLDGLIALKDDAVERELIAIPGIGPWTATIYLLMVLGRPDVWPVGDIALAQAVADVKGLATRPDASAMADLGEAWRPWRSVAARLFWHDYLSRRGRT
jgi:DNA-3-methyladenine glycosylase II